MVNFYGLWSNPTTSFRLTSVKVEQYLIQPHISEGTYLVLTSNNGEKLYFYGTNLSAALANEKQINQLLRNNFQPFLDLIISDKNIDFFSIIGIFIGFHILIFIFIISLVPFMIMSFMFYAMTTKK